MSHLMQASDHSCKEAIAYSQFRSVETETQQVQWHSHVAIREVWLGLKPLTPHSGSSADLSTFTSIRFQRRISF